MRRRLGIISAIVRKDLRLYLRDRFSVVVTVLGLAAYIALFWVLPADVDETIGVGIYIPGGEELLAQGTVDDSSGFALIPFESAEALAAAVEAGDEVAAGMEFPDGFLAASAIGAPTTVRVLLWAGAPPELRPALVGGVREIGATIGGLAPPVTVPPMNEVVLGEDRVGDQVPLREKLRPLLLFLILIVEMFALASLVAAEISQRTVTAVLATPARVGDLLAAKAILGTALAFTQAVVLALATRALGTEAPLLLVALLLGAVLVTGFGLIAGATGRDFVGIVFWSMLFVVPLTIPAFGELFPGTAAGWIRGLPTYGLVETIVGVTAYGRGWAESWPHLAVLSGWCVGAFATGLFALGRRAGEA